jgi:beta-1,4-mannosyl-glycoprotein beta-1,4-N-acetylglucosaminyltransferase
MIKLWRGGRSRGLVLRRKLSILLLLCLSAICGLVIYFHGKTVSYFLRPIWDTPPKPFQVIPHYYAENISLARLCELHGWSLRKNPRRVFDAVMFSNEIDLLEIRLQELMPYVTKFVVLESNTTFTGQPKPLIYQNNEQRFSFVRDKVVYSFLPGQTLTPKDPFVNEGRQRRAMDHGLHAAGVADGDLVIMADVDEIPSAHTIRLLQSCDGFPSIMHLQLRNYLYSYDFHVDFNSWRSAVYVFDSKVTKYQHGRVTDKILADAGWHCSFCFRYISDFIFKMQAYSHADRVRYSSYLDPIRIQDIICHGRDLFEMLPEEFSFRELIGKMGSVARSFSGVHLPAYLVENPQKFPFLLPGNCTREVEV